MPEDPADAELSPEHQPKPEVPEGVPDPSTKKPNAAPAGEDTTTAGGRPGVMVPSTILESAEMSDMAGGPAFSVTTEMVDRDVHFLAASYEGPLPPPAFLKGYEELSPGAAAEIISWVKTEGQHRRKMELAEADHRRKIETDEVEHRMKLETRAMELGERALKSGINRANVGMALSWPLVIGIVGAGTYLIAQDHDWAGTVIVDSALLIVVGAYVLNRLVRPRGENKPPESSEKGKKDEK